MIRKAIILVLTAGTIAGFVLWVTPILWRPSQEWISRSGPLQFVWAPPWGPKMQVRLAVGREAVLRTHHGVLRVAYHSRMPRGQGSSFNGWRFAGFSVASGIQLQRPVVPSARWARNWEEELSSTDARFLDTSVLHARVIGIPLWGLCLVLAAYPAIAFMRGPLRRWRRPRKGLCIKCGYDLTGNVSGVCPECGTRTGKGDVSGDPARE